MARNNHLRLACYANSSWEDDAPPVCYCGANAKPHFAGIGACDTEADDILCEDCLHPAGEVYSPGQDSVGIPGGYVSDCCRAALVRNAPNHPRVY